ncbi:MAG TPA: hypothetical protein VE398_01005 [Acidobacteriota bacterium]|nr:hypothetical protein [Acidobacteriota bacterium]
MNSRGLSIVALLILSFLGLLVSQPGSNQDWTHFVRIGGYGLRLDRIDDIVKNATETHVFGIETDNDIPGRYESFLDPTEKLKAIKAIAEKAHAARNYAYVYIAGLECITANADKQTHSFLKDHPDWVQRKVTGEPAVFGGGSAFWISKGDEDVWISPYAAEWRKIYMERVRQIAASGIDGVYVDIPYWMTHFDGWENTWASFDDFTVAAFKKETGLNARTDLKLDDFNDPGFRRWIDFRMRTLTDFIKEINDNVKSVSRQCVTIAEIYPGIEEDVVRVGADVYQMYPVVDAIAHEYNLASGGGTAAAKTPLDWFGQLIGILSFRSFAEGKASWMLTYSWDGEKKVEAREAMKNMFMAQLMAGANVWDARGHVMSGSNDIQTRREIFKWIAEHEKTFYLPRHPINPIGVYFSPQTRNYFAEEFIESYKGTLALLMQSHLEYQIVTPRTIRNFSGALLILPDVRCLSAEEVDAIRSYRMTKRGLIVTGETGQYNERRESRNANPIHELLGIGEPRKKASRGKEFKFIFDPNCPARAYFRQLTKEFDSLAAGGDYKGSRFDRLRIQFVEELERVTDYRPAVEIQASPFVASQISQVDGNPHVFMANFKGLKSKEAAVQTPEQNITISFPATRRGRVRCLPFLGTVEELVGKWEDGKVTCIVPETKKSMVVWVE